MDQSTITIDVYMDKDRLPESIVWKASDSSAEDAQKAKAMLLAFWDGAEKTALRIDLWTKEMMVDEMADFYYQIFMNMADTFNRSTAHKELVEDMKKFAHEFYEKFNDLQMKENKT